MSCSTDVQQVVGRDVQSRDPEECTLRSLQTVVAGVKQMVVTGGAQRHVEMDDVQGALQAACECVGVHSTVQLNHSVPPTKAVEW